MFCRYSSPGIRYCRTSQFTSFFSLVIHVDVFVIIRRLMFCAFELLDSYLPPRRPFLTRAIEICCVDASSTARLPSVCELLLLAATVAAFIARLLLGSESGGLRMSFYSCGTVNSPAVLSITSLLLTFLSTSFASASFNTSLLRTRGSAPSGVVLRRSSILTRQGQE